MSGFCPGLSGFGHLTGGFLAVLLATGCLISGEEGDKPPYLAQPGDEPCELTTEAFRVDGIDIPFTSAEVSAVGFNLNGDESGRPDNGAGVLYSVLHGQSDTARTDLSAQIDESLNDGTVSWVVLLSTCRDSDGSDGYAQVTVRRASDDDGDGRFELVGDEAQPATGYRIGGLVQVQHGTGDAPVSALVDVLGTSPVVWAETHALAVELERDAGGGVAGRIGFGLPDEHIALVAAPLAEFFTGWLEAGVSEFAAGADTNGDGVVSGDELMATRLYAALFGPDVDLYAEYAGQSVFWPDHDGVKDHLSFAAGFSAVPVELE